MRRYDAYGAYNPPLPAPMPTTLSGDEPMSKPGDVATVRAWIMTALVVGPAIAASCALLSQVLVFGLWHRFDRQFAVIVFGTVWGIAILLSIVVFASSGVWMAERFTLRDINGDGWIGEPEGETPLPTEDIRLVPVRRPQMVNGRVAREDLIYFIREICQTNDWTFRKWKGRALPSGFSCTEAYVREMIRPLTDAGIIVGYGPRTAGVLRVRHWQPIIRLLQLTDSPTALPDSVSDEND